MKKILGLLLLAVLLIGTLSNTNAHAEDKADNTWVPSWGSGYATTSSKDSLAVYMLADFGWDNNYSISGLKSDTNETLEVDIVFYNYDGNAFAKYYYGDDTRGTYWESNQPRAYLDTDASDSNNERNFCVGCADANQFTISTYYYWWGYGVKNSEGSAAKVVVQRGHRLPANVYSCWSVFSEENKIVIPFSSWHVPSQKTWGTY